MEAAEWTFKRVIKMPQKARFRKCPVCGHPKPKREFRNSNKDLTRNVICWLCRHSNPEGVQEYWTGIKELQKPVDRELIHARLTEHFAKRSRRKEGVVNVNKVEAQSAKYLKFPENVAKVIRKTFAVKGDAFTMEDDVALAKIRDLLDELNPELIAPKRKKKRLSK